MRYLARLRALPWRFIFIILSPCWLTCSIPFIFAAWNVHDERVRFEQYLSLSIQQEIVEDLCGKHLVPASIGDCRDPSLTLVQGDVPEIFRANLADDSTFDDVKQLFGDYELKRYCYMDRDPYSCQYRISAYDVVLFFDPLTDRILSWRLESPGS